jgi:hypothetical protein
MTDDKRLQFVKRLEELRDTIYRHPLHYRCESLAEVEDYATCVNDSLHELTELLIEIVKDDYERRHGF